MKAGYLWMDTGEYMEEQARAKDLMYEFNHTKPSEEQKRNELIKEIFGSVGDPVWIGAGAILLPGVTIGDNTVIGAGSIVTKDIPANVIAVGNPCRVMREITDRDKEYYYRDLRVDMQK